MEIKKNKEHYEIWDGGKLIATADNLKEAEEIIEELEGGY